MYTNPVASLLSPSSPPQAATLHLSNSLILWLRGISPTLALVSLVRSENFEKLGLVEYNFQCLKDGVLKVLHVKEASAAAAASAKASASNPRIAKKHHHASVALVSPSSPPVPSSTRNRIM